ncbi:Tenascin-X [Trichinella papuae]|uniref:Tenascin-X n=1 Tax=Trichinella papuae TaxID=268474 RepID=A0A0V1MWV9_9BILA|nr:Tenascin-X [Trichinella papuae]
MTKNIMSTTTLQQLILLSFSIANIIANQSCRYHTQCPGQAICVLRICIAAEPSGGVCQRQNDCKVGRACKHGICWQPAESPNVVAQCTVHEDCKSQTVCKNNTCVASSPIDRDCNKHSDCPIGDACKFGVCWRAIILSKDVECVITEDCVGRTLCDRRGSCRPARPTSVACDTDDNCGLLERCKHSMCWRYIIGECQRNEDCTGQRLCHQGRCVTSKPMDRYCNTDDDCNTNSSSSSSSNRGRCKYGLCWSFNERMKQHAEREELMDMSDEDAQQLLD